MKKFYFFVFALCVSVMLCGCASHDRAHSEIKYYAGDYAGAAAIWGEGERQDCSSDGVLDNLYMGAANFAAGNFARALADFSRAESGLEEQDHALNWGNAYVGRTYDGIMLNTYQAVAFMALHDPDRARVAFNRLENRLGMVSERSRKAIADRQEKIEKEKKKSDNKEAVGYLASVNANASNQRKINDYNRLLDKWGAYADYENPASRFLSGVFRMIYAYDNSDLEKALFQMKACYGMTQSEAAKIGMELAEGMINRRVDINDMMVVVFEDGLGATKEEYRFDLFIPLSSPMYAGIALPKLVERPAAFSSLALLDNAEMIGRTMPLCDIDRIVATEFRAEMPGIIAKEITECVIKVVLQAIAIEVARNNNGDGAALAVGIMGSLISYATTKADIRNWNYLPKDFQAAWIRKPKSGVLTIATPDGLGRIADVQVPANGPALVYVKIPAAGMPPMCALITP